MADIPGCNSVCKVMHGHESGLNVRRRTSSVLPVCPSIYLCIYVCVYVLLLLLLLLATSARYRESRSISPRVVALGLILSALVAAAAVAARARFARIVHAVLIGIHCRVSDLPKSKTPNAVCLSPICPDIWEPSRSLTAPS